MKFTFVSCLDTIHTLEPALASCIYIGFVLPQSQQPRANKPTTIVTKIVGLSISIMLVVLIQWYHVIVLMFNVAASLGALVGTGILTKLRLLSQQGDGTVEFPDVLKSRYQYPRSTDIAWSAAGGGFSYALLQCALYFYPGSPYFVWEYTQLIVILVGVYVALLRLDCWRLFVADFLREVHRLKEMSILNDVLQDISTTEGKKLKVLDFGGGKGKTTEHMLEHCRSTVEEVQAIDIEPHPPHVKKYDGVTIPFSPNSFDVSIAMYVFHHIPDTPALIQQLKRTCKHILIFEDLPHDSTQPLVARITFGTHFLLFNQSVHTHLDKSRKEWKKLFEQWGMLLLKEYEIQETTALPYKRIAFLLDTGKKLE